MSKLLFSVLFALVLALPSRADDPGPLLITPADGWTVKYDANTQSYNVVPPNGPAQNTLLLTFAHWPAPGTPAEIPGFLETMATKFADVAQHNPRIKLASAQYTKGEFIGDPYSGNYVEFTIKHGDSSPHALEMKQVLFIFGDNTGLWNGQYIGTADGWFDAMEVLKGIKKS